MRDLKVYRKVKQIVTLANAWEKNGRNLEINDLGLINNGAIVFDQHTIHWIGTDENIPEEYKHANSIELTDTIILPEIVDSHTHLIFGGDRATEYLDRLNGKSYVEIAQQGGGILSTMKGTNAMSRNELYNLSKKRIKQIHSYGVGTIEIKSGYGLNYEKEEELSEIIADLKTEFRGEIQILNTYMAAHAVPKAYNSSMEYLDKVVIPLLEKLEKKNIIDAIDIFHEDGYFTDKDVHKLFTKAQEFNIPVKAHVDEFNDNHGVSLACQYNALSVDHLLRSGHQAIDILSKSQTVATFLPGTGFFLGKDQANVRNFLDAGVRVAIASDYNPGSCHWDNILQIASMAAPVFQMNIVEVIAAISLNAAAALNLNDQGALKTGLQPRFSFFKTDHYANIFYNWGKNMAYFPH